MKRLGAFALVLSVLLLALVAPEAHAAHALARHGAPKYPAGFPQFDYVNTFAPKGGELRQAAIGTFDSLNPYILKGVPAASVGLVYETLMEPSLDEPFTLYGRIAQDVVVATNNSRVTFRLRMGARFQDGKPITPEDVIFSFETLRDKGHPFYRSYYKDVARAEKTGPLEVRFSFKTTQNAELPMILGQMPILPKHFWQGKDFAATTLEPPVGSGPYKIENVDPGRSITYKRVESWWGEPLPVNKGRYNFDRIRYDYYRDATVALEALFAGKYDFRLENSAKNWATAYTVPAVKNGLIVREEVPNALPSGMQGFIFNTRREIFKDIRVRRALELAFDFEWGNKNIAYGAYKRTNSYFANSEMAAAGLPSPEERAILDDYRGRVPDDVFGPSYEAPKTDGTGNIRENLRKAAALLAEAGWTVKYGHLVNAEGKIFHFEIVDSSPLFERWIQPFLRNLERLGIQASYRVVDSAQYQNRLNDFDFDMTVHVFGQSVSPGNEQRDYWSASKADEKGSRNLIGVRDPVVDELVERIVHAKDRAELVTLCRVLDRVLMAGHYVIPHWNFGAYRLAFWDIFGKPVGATPYGFDMESLWWIDPAKAAKINEIRKANR